MTIEWKAPAGGLWELETTHVRGAQPRVFQERATRAFRDPFKVTAARYGLPIDCIEARFVNDHCDARVRPVGAPEPKPGKPSKAPPGFVLWALARLHPELRRRAKAARRALHERVWREDLREWEESARPAMLATSRALQSEPIEQLEDDALVDHLARALDHLELGIGTHLQLTPVQDVTLGRLLLACRSWGIDDAEVFPLLAGYSPASAASATRLATIARALADAGVEPETLDDVRTASPEARAALDDYLADHGWRVVTQYSPRGVTLIEMPKVLLQAIAAAGKDDGPPPRGDVGAVRDRVPPSERPRFDDLLDDAIACYGSRDDNVALTFMWPNGLVRRTLLEAGRRLAERGVLADQRHVFALGQAEIAAALAGDTRLVAIAASRTAHGRAAEAGGAPAQLGDDEGPPPDPGLFPDAMAEIVRAMFLGFEIEGAFKTELVEAETWSGEGSGVGSTSYTGRACVAVDAEVALAKLQPGDVLVTAHTTPAYEAIMPIAGALVTDHGGLMSHAALVCRESGIPAVIGVAAATAHIPDGAIVTVDPATGRVLVDVAICGGRGGT
jgi:phosphohistidine swiveling domain-containing protein